MKQPFATLAAVLAASLLISCLCVKSSAAPRTPTFASDIAPIIYQNCASCHHAGQVAPFSLTSYQDVEQHAQTIAAATQIRYMPPWHVDNPGLFQNSRHLTAAQITLLKEWVKAGCPRGNMKLAPAAPHYNKAGWIMGTPDAVYVPSRSYQLAAAGSDVYRCFVIHTNYPTDRWVKSVEIRPGNYHVVHHIICYLDTSGAARKLEAATHDGQPGYISFGGPGFPAKGMLGGWAPGTQPMTMPHNVGILLPKGADIVMQVHYHKDGKQETDLSHVGLIFCKKPVDKKMLIMPLLQFNLNIPPNDPNYIATAQLKVPANVHLLSVFPHMHLLGHTMNVTCTLPSGKSFPLVTVPDWNFNWQGFYTYKKPLAVPAGSVLHLTASYNNTESNPFNPHNPPVMVHWGDQTTDEMCLCFITFTVDQQHLLQNTAYAPGQNTK